MQHACLHQCHEDWVQVFLGRLCQLSTSAAATWRRLPALAAAAARGSGCRRAGLQQRLHGAVQLLQLAVAAAALLCWRHTLVH
jgi:hypothetical protein